MEASRNARILSSLGPVQAVQKLPQLVELLFNSSELVAESEHPSQDDDNHDPKPCVRYGVGHLGLLGGLGSGKFSTRMNTDALLDTLRSDEGWRPYAYDDTEGFATIGYGFLVDARKGVGLPRPVAEFWLRYAVNERLAELQRLWPAFKDQPADVQTAVGNLAYQIGPAGVMKFKRMLAALAAGDRDTAADELVDSNLARQTPARTLRTARLLRGA